MRVVADQSPLRLVEANAVAIPGEKAVPANSSARRQLSSSHAYVPSNGMTDDPQYRCLNDQAFLCPRRLCRPYFRLLELDQRAPALANALLQRAGRRATSRAY